MSSWLGSIWGGEQVEQLDLDAVLGAVAELPPSADQAAQVARLLEQLRDLVVREGVLAQQERLGMDVEEKGKAIVRRCLWVALHFASCTPALRSALEALAHAVKKPSSASAAGDTARGSYLHLVLTEVLFEAVPEVAVDPTLSSARQRQLPPSQLGLLLDLLSQPDFHVRYSITDILCTLMDNGKAAELQAAILSQPMSVDRICALLEDQHDALRIQALRLLLPMTDSNVELQKLIAFGGTFETALRLVANGSSAWGDTTPLDSLRLIQHLLRNNVSNQNYFRETSCIPLLRPQLEVTSAELWGALSEQKKAHILATLEIVHSMLSGTNPSTAATQRVMVQCGILDQLTTLGLNRINSPEIRSKAMHTLAAVVRCNADARTKFAMQQIEIAGESTPQPTLHRLLTLAFRSPSFAERTAAVTAFTSYLRDNAEGQLATASTMNPPPDAAEASSTGDAHAGANSIGRQLVAACGASAEPVKSWLAAVMLNAILMDNSDCKQMALRIPLSLQATETLVQFVARQLKTLDPKAAREEGRVLVCISLLQLLCTWLFECPAAVNAFLSDHTNFPCLVDTVLQPEGDAHVRGLSALVVGLCFAFNERPLDQSNAREAVHGIINLRIGMHAYMAALDGVRKSSVFARAEQSEEGISKAEESTSDTQRVLTTVLYDYNLASQFRTASDAVVSELRSPGKRQEKDVTKTAKFKAMVSLKDKEIARLKAELEQLTSEETRLVQQHQEMEAACDAAAQETAPPITQEDLDAKDARIAELEQMLEESEQTVTSLAQVVSDLEQMSAESEAARLVQPIVEAPSAASVEQEGAAAAESPSKPDPALLRQLSELRKRAGRLESEAAERTKECATLAADLASAQTDAGEARALLQELQAQTATLRAEAQEARAALAVAEARADKAEARAAAAEAEALAAPPPTSAVAPEGEGAAQQKRMEELEGLLRDSEARYTFLQQEQEEVLILLAEEQVRNNNLEQRLIILEAAAGANEDASVTP